MSHDPVPDDEPIIPAPGSMQAPARQRPAGLPTGRDGRGPGQPLEIRWLPFEVGAHAAMTGAFRVLTFDDPEDPDVVYLETHGGANYLEKEAQLAEYRKIFELISKDSAPIGEYLP